MGNEKKSNRKKEITIDEIKKCKGFENLSSEERKEVIEDLESLAKLIIKILNNNGQIE